LAPPALSGELDGVLFLRPMMGKSHPPDKRRCRYACLPGRHEGYPIPFNGVSRSQRGML